MREVEPLHQLRARELLGIAVAPAKPREIVEHRFRQKAVFVVLQDAHRAVPLGEFLAIRPKDHRQMAELRQRRALTEDGAVRC